ncbi:MAG: hypothetical protein QNL33_14665 [Akkermansiaceae bacterium]|jgi:hypothetical protein
MTIGLGAWKGYQNSPEKQAGQSLKEASREASEGKHIAAAKIYRDHLNSGLPIKAAASEGF